MGVGRAGGRENTFRKWSIVRRSGWQGGERVLTTISSRKSPQTKNCNWRTDFPRPPSLATGGKSNGSVEKTKKKPPPPHLNQTSWYLWPKLLGSRKAKGSGARTSAREPLPVEELDLHRRTKCTGVTARLALGADYQGGGGRDSGRELFYSRKKKLYEKVDRRLNKYPMRARQSPFARVEQCVRKRRKSAL